jgi:type VI secretion system protein ImpK
MLLKEPAAVPGLVQSAFPAAGGNLRSGKEDQALQGIRYALTCWLDELFTSYSPWSNAWAAQRLEASLYGTDDRSWKFWEHARQALDRPGSDALEVYFLCVMLGFRGELAQSPDNLRSWLTASQARLANQARTAGGPPAESHVSTHVPPLRGREIMQRMVFVCGMTMVVLIPFIVFFMAGHRGP